MVYYAPDNDPTEKPKPTATGPKVNILGMEQLPPQIQEVVKGLATSIENGELPPEGGALLGPFSIPFPVIPPNVKIHTDAGGKKGKTLIVDPDHHCFQKGECESCDNDGECPMQDCINNASVVVECDNCDTTFSLHPEGSMKVREEWNCLLEDSVVTVFAKTCMKCSNEIPIYKVTEIRRE